jgi:hypothetical protein
MEDFKLDITPPSNKSSEDDINRGKQIFKE